MSTNNYIELYSALKRAILLAAGTVIGLWVLAQVYGAALFLLFALVLAVVINEPVTWLEGKGIKRGWAALIIFMCILLGISLIGWLIVPKVVSQLQLLINNLPAYLEQVDQKIDLLLKGIPELKSHVDKKDLQPENWLPSVSQAFWRITNFSLTLVSTILLLIIFFSMVVYAVVNPRPLLEIYFSWFHPSKRELAAKAYKEASTMLVGWLKSNLIGGFIEAIATTLVLSLLNVPGAWVWGALALCAELIPRIGFYIMAVPPTLVALSVSNTTALWVGLFFIAMDEIMGDFVMPHIRSSTMDIHPVSIMFMVLAMGAAFGFTGILLAVPMAAILKAYYENFYVNQLEADPDFQTRIHKVIYSGKK